MAKPRTGRQRDTSDIAIGDPLKILIQPKQYPMLPPMPVVLSPRFHDNSLADRRTYFPDRRLRPAAAVTRQATRIVARDRFGHKIRSQNKAPLAFRLPKLVAVCVKRKIRNQVLHATGISHINKLRRIARGKGGGKPRRNYWSKISCR